MSPSVDIDADIFEYLQSQAEPFTDTPSTVLRRLLGIDQPAAPTAEVASENDPSPPSERAARPKRRSGARKPRAKGRAATGTLLPEDRYELPLLRALSNAGGEAPYREVVASVGEELKDALMPADFETLASGNIRWHSRIQFVRLRLVERGEMDRNSPRGVWRIADAGRKRLEQETKS